LKALPKPAGLVSRRPQKPSATANPHVTSPDLSVVASMRAAAPVAATRIDFHGVSVCVTQAGSVGEETVSTSAESRAVAKTEGQNSLLRWLIFI
jgi:hypothetical protein